MARKTSAKTPFNSQKINGHIIINIVICVLRPPLKCILGAEENLTYFPSNPRIMEKIVLCAKKTSTINLLINNTLILNGDVNHKNMGENLLFNRLRPRNDFSHTGASDRVPEFPHLRAMQNELELFAAQCCMVVSP
ncbi:TPA: hypothetical protein ACXGKJ_000963 [Klebsiella oxytoca]